MWNKKNLLFALLVILMMAFTNALADEINVTPENISTMVYQDGKTYVFEGNFTNEVNINTQAKNLTFDGSKAAFSKHVIIQFGMPVDNQSSLQNSRSGNYVIKNFSIEDSLAVITSATTLTVKDSTMKALALNASNSKIIVENNTLNNDGEYRDHNVAWVQKTKAAFSLYANKYNLELRNNHLTSKNGNTVTICGENGHQQGSIDYTNKTSMIDNIIRNEKDGGHLVYFYNDVTYAPVAWPEEYEVTKDLLDIAEEVYKKNDVMGTIKNAGVGSLARKKDGPDKALNEFTFGKLKEIADRYVYTRQTPEVGNAGVENLPQTGDNSNLLFFAALLALSGAGMMLLKKRSMNR